MLTEHPRFDLLRGHCHSELRSGTAVLKQWLPRCLGEHRADMCTMLEGMTGCCNPPDWDMLS
jgi:hypothetical protein